MCQDILVAKHFTSEIQKCLNCCVCSGVSGCMLDSLKSVSIRLWRLSAVRLRSTVGLRSNVGVWSWVCPWRRFVSHFGWRIVLPVHLESLLDQALLLAQFLLTWWKVFELVESVQVWACQGYELVSLLKHLQSEKVFLGLSCAYRDPGWLIPVHGLSVGLLCFLSTRLRLCILKWIPFYGNVDDLRLGIRINRPVAPLTHY